MTMYISRGESNKTDGAVSFGCTDNIKYGWGIDGDWKNIVAIEDLSDKQWHKVEFPTSSLLQENTSQLIRRIC